MSSSWVARTHFANGCQISSMWQRLSRSAWDISTVWVEVHNTVASLNSLMMERWNGRQDIENWWFFISSSFKSVMLGPLMKNRGVQHGISKMPIPNEFSFCLPQTKDPIYKLYPFLNYFDFLSYVSAILLAWTVVKNDRKVYFKTSISKLKMVEDDRFRLSTPNSSSLNRCKKWQEGLFQD
jgi:hypothetical protein